jgi:hypothetical protein
MAFREVTVLQVKEVLRLWLAGAEEAHRRAARLRREDGPAVRRRRGRARAPLDDAVVAEVVAATWAMVGRPQGDGWSACAAQRALFQSGTAHRV